jgi:hypothetical protein
VFPSWEGTISALPSLASKPKPGHAKVAQRARADGRCADWRELRERIPGEWPLGLFAGVATRRSAGVARIENWVSFRLRYTGKWTHDLLVTPQNTNPKYK